MEALFIFAAAVCVLYFVLIVAYSGIGTSFCFVWLFFAGLCTAMSWFCIYIRGHKNCLPRRGIVFISTSFILGIAVLLVTVGVVLHASRIPPKKDLDYVIVLGAKVYPDRLSKSLKNRLDRAYEYYKENPDTKFVLSGGQGKDEYLPEAVAMYNYLHLKGIPGENMIMEIFSESTTENIAYSKLVIEEDAYRTRVLHKKSSSAESDVSVGVLTNDFHVMRAVMIAKERGIKNISGISAPSDPVLFPHFCVRECAAIIKDRIMGNM